MILRTNKTPKAQGSQRSQGENPHWVFIAGGALLSSLSIRLGYMLKQALDNRQQNQDKNSNDNRRPGGYPLHSNEYPFTTHEDIHFSYNSADGGIGEGKHLANGHMMTEAEGALPLVTVPVPDYGKENGVVWASSPDRLELPPKRFHHSNCSLSPSVSESGSDVFSKREVIHKLRQQLKRRDDMILEMQDQILELQNSLNSLNSLLSNSSHLQSQLDAANQDLFESEREIQRLRKAIADHCVGQVSPKETAPPAPVWPTVGVNGHCNGNHCHKTNLDPLENGRGTTDRIEMLRREVGELKEVIESKDYLLQSYKEQKSEMSVKIKELQHRLDSQLPNML